MDGKRKTQQMKQNEKNTYTNTQHFTPERQFIEFTGRLYIIIIYFTIGACVYVNQQKI